MMMAMTSSGLLTLCCEGVGLGDAGAWHSPRKVKYLRVGWLNCIEGVFLNPLLRVFPTYFSLIPPNLARRRGCVVIFGSAMDRSAIRTKISHGCLSFELITFYRSSPRVSSSWDLVGVEGRGDQKIRVVLGQDSMRKFHFEGVLVFLILTFANYMDSGLLLLFVVFNC